MAQPYRVLRYLHRSRTYFAAIETATGHVAQAFGRDGFAACRWVARENAKAA